tara:strand:+ start:350 stop:1279 length:930 start_codon:yes stop_codon:yes gene_type:complete
MKKMYTPQGLAFSICCLFLILSFSTFAQVGIGNTDPKTALDVNGALSLREGSALTVGNGINIDLGTTVFSQYRITDPTADFSISTFLTANGVSAADGQLLTLINTTPYKMTLIHDQGSNANPQRRIYCPGETNLVLNGRYSTVTLQYNVSLLRWVIIKYAENETPIDSVTLTSNYTLAAGNFSDVPTMSLTFVARKTSVMVTLSGSGDANAQLGSGIGDFRVFNVTSNTIFGGTHQNITTFDDVYGVLGSAWSISFTKPLTGLTIGNSYTLKVQALFDPRLVASGQPALLRILPVSSPSDHHLTLSVMQ